MIRFGPVLVFPWMQKFVLRFIAHPELPGVPFSYRARNRSCPYGQDISSTPRRRSMRGELPHLPHNYRIAGWSIRMHLTFAKKASECPVCESNSVRRSTRTGFVERIWFRFAFVWPYRCDDCDSRFWGFQRSL